MMRVICQFKILAIIVLSFFVLSSKGQVYQSMPQYGYSGPRFNMDSTLSIPTVCGVPTLKSNLTKKAAIAFDSCNGVFYQYNPKTLVWSQITGGGGSMISASAFGSFYDSTTQTIANTTIAYPIKLTKIDTATGFRLVNNKIIADSAGVYNMQWSGQFQNTDNAEQDVTVWIRKNGINVVGSAGYIAVPKTRASLYGHTIASWNYIIPMVAGDSIVWYWQANNTGVSLQYYPQQTSPTRPSTASVIVTITPATGGGGGGGGTVTKAVDTLYRTIGKDSIQFKINGVYYAIKDSSGGGGIVTRAVDTIYRTPGKDSIVFTIAGVRRAIKDSISIAGGGSPAGPTNAIQYNNFGSFGGNPNLTFNGPTGTVGVGNPVYYYAALNINDTFTSNNSISGTINSSISLQNSQAYGQNTIYSEIASQPKGLWRSDYEANNYWTAFGGNHYFYTGGDVGQGTSKLTIFDNGNVSIGDSLFWNYGTNRLSINAGTSPNSALTVKGSDGINFYGLPQRNDYSNVLCYNSSNGQLGYKAVSGTGVDTIYRTNGKDSIIFTINGKRYAIKDSVGTGGGGAGNPAGSNGYVQFNSSGSFGADSSIFWNNTNKRLGIGTTQPRTKLDVALGKLGNMPYNYEMASFSRDGDAKLGVYNADNYSSGTGASITLGNIKNLNANNHYPGFEFQNVNDSETFGNSYTRYNYLERGTDGNVAAANVDLFNIYADGRVVMNPYSYSLSVNPRLIIGGDNTGATLEVLGNAYIDADITCGSDIIINGSLNIPYGAFRKHVNFLNDSSQAETYYATDQDNIIIYATYLDNCEVFLPDAPVQGQEIIIKQSGETQTYGLYVNGNGHDIWFDEITQSNIQVSNTAPHSITLIYNSNGNGFWYVLNY